MKTIEATIPSNAMLAAPAIAGAHATPMLKEHWAEVLDDGHHVLVRSIRKDDIELERRFIECLSPRSRRFRFLGEINSPSSALLKQLVDIDPVNDLAYIAVVVEGMEEREIGVARLSAKPDGRTCEFAVTVSDEWQHRGLGTLLMQHLIGGAMARGIESIFSIDAADNDLMRDFAKNLGCQRAPDPNDATQVLHTLDLTAKGGATI